MKDVSLGKLIFIALGLFAVLGGGAIFIHSLFTSLDENADQISKLQAEFKDLENKKAFLEKKRIEYARWVAISLPPDLKVAEKRYHTLLVNLVQKNNLEMEKIGKGTALQSGIGRSANLTPLAFSLTFKGTLGRVIGFFDDFYMLNLPHQIRACKFTPQAAGAEGKLQVTMTIEAAILPGAFARDFLPAMVDKRIWALEVLSSMNGLPAGLALGPSMLAPTGIFGGHKLAEPNGQNRDYLAIVQKNPFGGLVNPAALPAGTVSSTPDRDVLKDVELTLITTNAIATEALLHNKITNTYTKLRAEGGRDQFEIRDENHRLVLKGKVVSITPRRLTFQTEGKSYNLDVGQYLAEVLKVGEGTGGESKAEGPKTSATAVEDDSSPD